MNMDRGGRPSADEYYVTALQIFDYCGAESSDTLRVDALMDKFAPFVTNKPECSYLKSLLDPDQDNPAITVSMLAKTLHQYSESQKSKVDLDESFNLRNGQAPQDSDSGISTDGFQLLEELQCELREKAHLAHQLRSQLDFTDRQHEEQLAALTAERDSLRAHLNMLREENMTLSHVRRDYDEACDRLCGSEVALDEARRELEGLRRRAKLAHDQLATLENEKVTLQELLGKSKEECHRINEMYATRQSALLEQNESLRGAHADLAARLHDQDDLVHQLADEKVLLEMELKETLNKWNQTQHRLDRSIDMSYTEDQMLTALDTLNADTGFSQENRILDEESFLNALKEDQGRATNISLFDEIRYSFCNMSKHTDLNRTREKLLDSSFITIGTQTEENIPYSNIDKIQSSVETQTEHDVEISNNNNIHDSSKCLECDNINKYTAKLERDVNMSHRTVTEMQFALDRYEDNLNVLQKFVNEGNERNCLLQEIVRGLESKIGIMEGACANQRERLCSLTADTCCGGTQTECDVATISTQVDVPCSECEKCSAVVPHRGLRRFFWEPLKALFQLFAVICFVCAISVLYGFSRRERPACRDAVPWRWLDAQDLMDLLLRIEYVADVPM